MTLPVSAWMVLPTMAAMFVGYRVHDRLDQEVFRQATLAVLVLTGLNLLRAGAVLGELAAEPAARRLCRSVKPPARGSGAGECGGQGRWRWMRAAEFERLNALRRYAILDTPPDGAFDRVTELAAEILEVPVAVVSLVDANRVWMKSVHGPFPSREIERLPALCAAAIGHDGAYLVENASADPRTQEHPLVAGPFGLEFYVGRAAPDLRRARARDALLHRHPAARRDAAAAAHPRDRSPAIVMDEIELRRSAAQISRLSEALADACSDLERRASFDPLTGVLARAAMLERSAALIEPGARRRARGRRCSCSTSTASRRSTTPMGTGSATGC